MTRIYTLLLLLFAFSGCAQDQTQTQEQVQEQAQVQAKPSDIQVGGPCEGCEAVFEYGERHLTSIDTLEDFNQAGPRIAISGTVYQPDGKTPAKDVILYLYHTDQYGKYKPNKNETGWGQRHGSLRTWLKTNDKGQYAFYTLRPASYPNSTIEAHIHVILKETGKSPYWIDEFLFDDDPFLTASMRRNIQGRGGFTGVLKNGVVENGVTKYERNITLGLNVY